MAKLYGEIAAKSLLTLDKSFARANGQPLDASEVYYSLAAAEEYAAGAQAYIGQKIVVVENGKITHYSVEDAAGTLKELGAATLGDNKTIDLGDNKVLSLHNYEKSFYKYVPASGTTAATYEKVNVGDPIEEGSEEKYTWSEGLQPRVVKENDKYVIGWYEPNPTTVEGLDAKITALDGEVGDLELDIEGLNTRLGAAASGETVATGVYKYVDDEIKSVEEAIGNITHFTTEVVESTDDVVAEGVLYLIKDDKVTGEDKYDEYLYIGGEVVLIGDTTTDLSNYYTKTDADGKFALKTSLENDYYTNMYIDDNFASIERLNDDLSYYYTKEEIDNKSQTDLSNYYTKTEADEYHNLQSQDISKLTTQVGHGWPEPSVAGFKSVKQVTDEHATAISNINTNLSNYATNEALNGVKATADAAASKAAANETAIGTANTNIGDLQTRMTTAEGTIASNKASTEANTASITTLNGQVATKAEQSALDAAIGDISKNASAIKTLNETTIPSINTEIGKKANTADLYTKTEIDNAIATAKSEATYDDTKVKEDIAANSKAISDEVSRATTAEAGLSGRLDKVEDFFEFADGDTVNTALDTLAEIQDYLDTEGAEVDELLTKVNSNEEAITKINNTTTGAIATAKAYTDAQLTSYKVKDVDGTSLQLNETGVASIKAVSTDLLINGTEVLIINGGSAIN